MAEGGSGNNTGDWCTIESDPGVFTELLEALGCTKVQLEELYSLDNESLSQLAKSSKHIYGFIFLFQWDADTQQQQRQLQQERQQKNDDSNDSSTFPEDLFFAHQVTTNACATQAILSVLLNAANDQVELGTILSDFKNFTMSFPPNLKGMAISSSNEIRTAHNSFARPESMWIHDGIQKHFTKPVGEESDVYHFVAYIPKHGKVYELDGLQEHPNPIGEYNDNDNDNNNNAETIIGSENSWVDVARNAIQARMQTTAAIKFNLMAVVRDKRLQEGIDDYTLQMEQTKRQQWKLENQRRRHNYVPLCMKMLQELAKSKQLETFIQQAKDKQKERLEQKRKHKK